MYGRKINCKTASGSVLKIVMFFFMYVMVHAILKIYTVDYKFCDMYT